MTGMQSVARRRGAALVPAVAMSWLKDITVVITTIIALTLLTFPWAWMFLTSVTPQRELFSSTLRFIGSALSFEHYRGLLELGFPRYVLNSFLVSTVAVVGATLLSVPAAYAFSRFSFRGKQGMLGLVSFTQMFPFIVLVTPIYAIFWRLGLVNTYTGLIIAYIAITTPFSIYMLLGYFSTIPRELDDAAAIDGCSAWGTIWRIVLPVSAPGVVATAMYGFATAWNELVFALTLLTRTELKTVPVGLAAFFGEYGTEWGRVMAASSLATLPTLVVFLLLQQHLVPGLTGGALKD